MMNQLLTARTTVLILAGCVVAGGLAAMFEIYRSTDDIENIFESPLNERDENAAV